MLGRSRRKRSVELDTLDALGPISVDTHGAEDNVRRILSAHADFGGTVLAALEPARSGDVDVILHHGTNHLAAGSVSVEKLGVRVSADIARATRRGGLVTCPVNVIDQDGEPVVVLNPRLADLQTGPVPQLRPAGWTVVETEQDRPLT